MNFRRVLTALTLIAVFAAVASAQLPTSQNLTCSTSAATSPSLRSESLTDLVGDVLITCTGGPVQGGGSTDLGNVKLVIDYGVPVTSRAMGAALSNGNQPIEAVAIVDEPGTTGAPASLPLTVCAIGATCTNAVVAGPPETLSGPNAFQGYIPKDKPNQVAFDSVPVLTLGGTSFQHIFRISNVRVTPGSAPVVATVTATALTGSNIGMGLNPTTATVGTPAQGLTTSVSAPGLSLCNTTDIAGTKGSPNMALLTFKENFNGAFKSQQIVNPQTTVTGSYTLGSGSSAYTVTTAMSESGVVVPGLTATVGSTTYTAGLADSPTRLKAVFTGLETTNVTYYVSRQNVIDYTTPATTARATLLPQSGGETAAAGVYPDSTVSAWGSVAVIQLTVSSKGVAEAVWEISNPDYKNAESLSFSVYAVYNTVTAPPKTSSAQTIQLGFAPTITSTATDAANSWIPRFVAPPAAVPGAPVLLCQTSLLFPYVTNVAGWETGVAISNTGLDPLSTVGSSGTCALTFYGTNAPTAPVAVASLAAGATYANTISGMGLANFTGYMVGVCNFKYAHGFAFINDGKQNMAMGYLALVMTGSGRGTTLLGEALNQ